MLVRSDKNGHLRIKPQDWTWLRMTFGHSHPVSNRRQLKLDTYTTSLAPEYWNHNYPFKQGQPTSWYRRPSRNRPFGYFRYQLISNLTDLDFQPDLVHYPFSTLSGGPTCKGEEVLAIILKRLQDGCSYEDGQCIKVRLSQSGAQSRSLRIVITIDWRS